MLFLQLLVWLPYEGGGEQDINDNGGYSNGLPIISVESVLNQIPKQWGIGVSIQHLMQFRVHYILALFKWVKEWKCDTI